MQVIAYLGKDSLEGRRLEETIRRAARIKARRVALCRTLRVLLEELQSSSRTATVVVLLAASRRALLNLLSFQKHLDRFPLIMIVPDAQEKTLAKVHRLKPRYVAMKGSGFADVEFMLARLLEQTEPSHMLQKE